jgi:hypothetical protein
MDETFQLRARRPIGHRPARPDFALLRALLEAQQASSPAARAQQSRRKCGTSDDEIGCLLEIILGGPDWRQAVLAQQGCFNRAEARRHRNVL